MMLSNNYDRKPNGSRVEVACTASGFPRPNVIWERGGHTLFSTEHVINRTTVTKTLFLENVS